MKLILATLFGFFLFGKTIAQVIPQKKLNTQVQVQTTPAFPAGSEKLFTESMQLINARHATWIKSTAQKVNEKKWTDEQVKIEASNWAVLGNINSGDIEAMCFLVLMQAAKSAQEDLKAIMSKVKAINNQKSKQRELLSKYQDEKSRHRQHPDSFQLVSYRSKVLLAGGNPDTVKLRSNPALAKPSKAGLDALVDTMKNDLDSMSEMGEMESLRLQMAMDRLSKMMSTLSNILKKISDTAQSITQNLK